MKNKAWRSIIYLEPLLRIMLEGAYCINHRTRNYDNLRSSNCRCHRKVFFLIPDCSSCAIIASSRRFVFVSPNICAIYLFSFFSRCKFSPILTERLRNLISISKRFYVLISSPEIQDRTLWHQAALTIDLTCQRAHVYSVYASNTANSLYCMAHPLDCELQKHSKDLSAITE